MLNWWISLDLIQQIFALIAIPSTLILLVQTILLLIGLGDGGEADGGALDADGDIDDVDASSGDGLALFSIRGIVSMLAVMGWSGMALLETALPDVISIIIAVALGIGMLFLMAYIMKWVSKLQSSGNIDVGNAIGKVAQVYLAIPPSGEGAGKVNITIQDKYCEFNAITTVSSKIKTGAYVRVVAVDEIGTLVVEPIAMGDGSTR